MRISILRLLSATTLAFALVNHTGLNLSSGFSQLGWNGDRVEAKSRSSGRARGGSFRRSSPSNSSSRSNSSGSSNRSTFTPSRSSSPSRISSPVIVPRSNSGPVIIHSGSTTSSSTATEDDWTWLWVLLFLGVSAAIVFFIWKALRSPASGTKELANDTVTVTQLQVALLAQARQIQTDLTHLTLEANTETPEGLTELLRESVLALLRSPENWSHVRVSSQTVKNREEAAQMFEQLSIQERSKTAAETLVNVSGRVRKQSISLDLEAEPASYVVVTLLIGTEDDRPLLSTIHTTTELTDGLNRLATIAPGYLSVFELLWSPQDTEDSLSRDQLLADYPDLIQIA